MSQSQNGTSFSRAEPVGAPWAPRRAGLGLAGSGHGPGRPPRHLGSWSERVHRRFPMCVCRVSFMCVRCAYFMCVSCVCHVHVCFMCFVCCVRFICFMYVLCVFCVLCACFVCVLCVSCV